MSQGDIGYRVSIAAQHLALLREWGTRVLPGVDPRTIGRTITGFMRLLQRSPNEWGDPIRELRHAGLTVRRGIHEGIIVEYGVDAAHHVVYVRDIRLAQWHPLYRDEA